MKINHYISLNGVKVNINLFINYDNVDLEISFFDLPKKLLLKSYIWLSYKRIESLMLTS